MTVLSILTAALWCAGISGCAAVIPAPRGADAAMPAAVDENPTGSVALAAILDAGVGGVAGVIIEHQMDTRAAELGLEVPGAHVERFGEGIHVTFPVGLLFDIDSDVILPDAVPHMDQFAKYLSRYVDSNLMIVGYTDALGASEKNEKLSRKRAKSAARYLAARGVVRPIATVGRGEHEPIATNGTEAGRETNRRMEVAIYASEERRAAARQHVGPPESSSTAK